MLTRQQKTEQVDALRAKVASANSLVAVDFRGMTVDDANSLRAKLREAGADEVGGNELAKKITDGWLEFDRVLATPDMMGVVGKLGRVLGPRGLMPNPKVGTVTQDIGRAVAEQKAGKIEFRVDKNGIVHAPFGKLSFSKEQLGANLLSITEAIVRAKPASAKGVYMKKVSISSTMGPGIRLDPADLQAQLAS